MGYENDLANLGLLSGGAQGFIKGIQDAEDHSIRQEDMKMRRMEMDAKMRTQENEREQQREIRARDEAIKARTSGFKAQAGQSLGDTSPEQWQQDPEWEARQLRLNEARAGADPFGAKAAQATNAKLDMQKKQLEASQAARGHKLPPDKVLSVEAGAQIPLQLDDLAATLEQNAKLFGPMQGRLGAMNPYDTQSQTVDAQIRSQAQAFGRYMEGGVLRKEDEEKYRKMFPQLVDTPDVAKNKLAIVRKLLVDKQNADTSALGAQGYDTAGFKKLAPASLPKGLGKLKTGLVAEPKAGLVKEAAGPKRGDVVDGYEFLGGDPGDQKSWRKK